jgi:hypothetical protein
MQKREKMQGSEMNSNRVDDFEKPVAFCSLWTIVCEVAGEDDGDDEESPEIVAVDLGFVGGGAAACDCDMADR